MKKSLLVVVMTLSFTAIHAQSNSCGTLSFAAKDFNNDEGSAEILLFRNGDKIPTHPYKHLSATINGKAAHIVFSDIPYGEYAAILLHDANNNGEIDHSFGLPSEQLGYTNKWKLGFFTGMPTFSKLKFKFTASSTEQEIHITYRKNK